MTTDNIPVSSQMAPHSQEAEEAVLGSVLINPDAFYEVAAFLIAEDFFLLRNSWVWEAMVRLNERSEVIEYLTVIEELRSQGRLNDIGGAAYITYLISNTPTSIHAEAYGRLVQRAAIRRRLLEAAEEINTIARQEDADINEVIDRAEGTLFRVTEQRSRKDLISMQQALSDYYDRIEYLYTNQDEKLGVPTGFMALDNLLGGFQKGDLIIIAARPGVGKTSLMLNMAMNATRSKARVAVFSLEMSTEQLIQRLVATETRINQQKLRLGQLNEHEWDLFVEATGSLGGLKMFLDDTPALSVMQLRTKCRRLYRESGLDLVIVDYLQLMTTGGRVDGTNRVQEISHISRNLKEIAREINVPIVAGAQLSRAVEQRTDKRPVLSDLRESGSIEQDADVVMFIYRDEMYNENTERPNEADIIVAKHRNGPTGQIELFFNKELTQFANLKRSSVNLEDF
ncbi:MAG: replicative DNA helicase [Anaerolineae bacterium]|nr:MAG: replicative DNA helicase [Anaerolineae bacterium]MCL4877706.1 replicative DNA helicase [Anaerolineae bacterium]